MNLRCGSIFLGIACCWATLPAHAQEGPPKPRRYFEIPFEGKKFADLDEALRALDQRAPEAFKLFKSRYAEFGLDQPEVLKKILQNQEDPAKLVSKLNAAVEQFKTEQKKANLPEPARKDVVSQPQPVERRPANPSREIAPARPPETPADDLFARLARDVMERADRYEWNEVIKDSPALREGAEELKRWLAGDGIRGESIPSGLGRWADALGAPDVPLKLPNLDWLKPQNALPSLPVLNLHVPQPHFLPNLPRFGLPHFGAPSPGGPSFGSGFLWLAVAGMAFLIGWQALRHSKGARAGEHLAGWRLGPWPVHPAHVASPADLIKAFEYLSLLRLGPDARSWNHQTIAKHLEEQTSQETPRQAARDLAGLYERARYAPASEVLTPESLELARRDLCLLAGVAIA